MRVVQVAAILFAFAVVNAAPIGQHKSLADQLTAMYNDMLVQEEAPFDDVQADQESVFQSDNATTYAFDTLHSAHVAKPFKVSAARDTARSKAEEETNAEIHAKQLAYDVSQNDTLKKALAAEAKADATATATDKAVVEKVHEILHPDAPEQEQKVEKFQGDMKNAAEATFPMDTTGEGENFESGKLGDTFSNTGAAPEMADIMVPEVDNVIANMKHQDKLAQTASEALYQEMLDFE